MRSWSCPRFSTFAVFAEHGDKDGDDRVRTNSGDHDQLPPKVAAVEAGRR